MVGCGSRWASTRQGAREARVRVSQIFRPLDLEPKPLLAYLFDILRLVNPGPAMVGARPQPQPPPRPGRGPPPRPGRGQSPPHAESVRRNDNSPNHTPLGSYTHVHTHRQARSPWPDAGTASRAPCTLFRSRRGSSLPSLWSAKSSSCQPSPRRP